MRQTESFPQGAASPPKLSKDDINALPLFTFEGKITLVRTEKELDGALERLTDEPVLGLDTETRPSFSKGKVYQPSLIQLATEDEVFLFHLKWLPLNNALTGIFENPTVTKTGVAVHDDLRFLARISPFTPRSIVDLAALARRHKVPNQGLRALAARFLGLRISKSEQCSNWANAELTPKQIRYAATDAWASRAVFLEMRNNGLR